MRTTVASVVCHVGEMGYHGERTYQDGDEDLEDAHRVSLHRVSERQKQEDIGCGDEDAGPERKAREEHAERDGGPEKLREVCADDCDLGEHVERVQDRPPPEQLMFWSVVQEKATVRGKIWKGIRVSAGACMECEGHTEAGNTS